jgi:succinate dehydrogenase / fumarate reductase flavoprotein subunit
MNYETHDHDVIVIGAGGAGMRAAIEAATMGCSVGLICKSLLGKAHTVMAEGGAAAALANVEPRDNWKVHFRDTMRGGKLLNNWRMAQIHAQEAPDRILELEAWGAVFDRTKDGLILQRNFGGHRFPRLAHVGDRTGLEIIRTLQDRAVHTPGVEVFMECTVVRLLQDANGRVNGALAYWRESGKLVVFQAKAVILATGGIGKAWAITSGSWEYTGDGHALAYHAGADLIDMEFMQFHPTGMVWPPSVRGILVTEGVRGEGGILKNANGERFMFDYIPPTYAKETADTEQEAADWLAGKEGARRPPELLTRDVVARAIAREVREGRGSPHGGVFLQIAGQRSPEDIKRKLPSMYHQFKELGDVDITTQPMEVGPTAHYVMGGVRVDAETQAATLPGLFAAGEVAAGLHGSNRLGGNSLSDLLVFGRRAGIGAAEYARGQNGGSVDESQAEAFAKEALAPFDNTGGENPYIIQQDLQQVMQDYAGIARNADDLKLALDELAKLNERAGRVSVTGNRQYNPGWHAALDIRSLLAVSESTVRAALLREESRGGHMRTDFPETDEAHWGTVNVVIRKAEGGMQVVEEPLPQMPDDLREIVAGDIV